MLPNEDPPDVALELRRQVLGREYVDAAIADDSPGASEFQRFVTAFAWGTWARPGLSLRDRSLLVLAMTGGMGRMEEFALHLRGAERNGLTDLEIDEIVIQLVSYAGAPAGVSARRAVKAFRLERAAAGAER
jgi:4-carboxymuconolactone decarboxylase